MDKLLTTSAVGVAILSLTAVILLCIVLPIWSLIDCATSKTKGDMEKVLCVGAILLLAPLSVFYGLLLAESRVLKVLSKVGLIMIFAVLIILPIGLSWAGKMSGKSLESYIAQTRSMDLSDLSETEGIRFWTTLKTLQDEIADYGIFNPEKKLVRCNLQQLAGLYLKDHKLTHSEYSGWMEKFSSRASLKRGEIEEYVHQLKKES